jgi:hypothetical protein
MAKTLALGKMICPFSRARNLSGLSDKLFAPEKGGFQRTQEKEFFGFSLS